MTSSSQKRVDYRILCRKEETIPLFCQDWWLDLVCGEEQWEVALTKNNGTITAALPYWPRRRWGMRTIGMPPLTQSLGPWIRYPADQKQTSKLAFEKDILTELVQQLPRCSLICQRLDPQVTNWLPLYWQGFSQTTRYTYLLPDLSNLETLFSAFQTNIKTDIRKAERKLQVTEGTAAELFYLQEKAFARQGLPSPYPQAFLSELLERCKQRNCCQLFVAKDAQGHSHASSCLVWDSQEAVYLVSGSDPQIHHSGANSLLLWNAIQHAAQLRKRFNFGGSMIEPVERFLRGFGGTPHPYLQVGKVNSLLIRLYRALNKRP